MARREDYEWQIFRYRMHERIEGFGCFPLVVFVIVIGMVLLCSCGSKKEMVRRDDVSMRVESDISSTGRESVRDIGVRLSSEKEVVDSMSVEVTVEKRDSIEVVVGSDGNVMGRNEWHIEKTVVRELRDRKMEVRDSTEEWKSLRDSVAFYKKRYDSLMDSRKEEAVMVKELTWWEKACIRYGVAMAISALLAVVILVWWFIRKIPWLRR